MKILGIDAATKKTGYSVLDCKTGKLLDYGLIKANSENVKDRMKEIYQKLTEIILKEKTIKVVVVEDVPISSHNNLKTGKELSTLQGVILGVCFEQCLPLVTYAPSAWRSIIGLYDGTRSGMKRAVQKELAVKTVNELYNLNFNYYVRDTKSKQSDDDVAESILISRAYFIENKEDL